MKPFIKDNERVLDATSDLLKTGVYAANLEKVIENTPRDSVFTIGLFGSWGTGKSSIIRTVQKNIEGKHEDVKFITYDAWKYANDSFRRMFLLKVQQELKMPQTQEMFRFYQSETTEAEPKLALSAKGIAIAVLVIAFISILILLTPISIEWKIAFPTIGTMGTFICALLNGMFYELKISYNKPPLLAPEQFESCFKQIMSKCLKRKKWFQKIWSAAKDYVEVGEMSIIGLEKLVIVIDNIDRCPSDMAYQLLTDIKTFLSNENYNLVFIIPVDDEALKKHLFHRWNNANDMEINKEKEEFLRKFFNVTLRIKPHQEPELLHFTHEINREGEMNFNNDTIAIVSKEFSNNPRRIIQLLNNLSGDLALYDEEFAIKYETEICVALILREEYTAFYKNVTTNFDLIRKFTPDVAKDIDGNVNEHLVNFMRVIKVIIERTPLDVLQLIFTNTYSIFSDLPKDIQEAVITYDIDKVIAFAHTNEAQKVNIFDFALDKLSTEVKYGATSQTTQWIDFFSQLYKANMFDSSRFSALNSSLAHYYKTAIPLIKNQDALNYFGSSMSTLGYIALRNAVIDFLNDESFSENGMVYDEVLKCYLKYYTLEKDINSITSIVENYYVSNPIKKDLSYSGTQIKHLFGDKFIITQIENLKTPDDSILVDNIIWCIGKNNELEGETFVKLFNKFVELFGNTRGKKTEEYMFLIRNMQPVINVIGTSFLNTEPQQIYNLIIGTRAIPHPTYMHNTGYDTQRSILDEVDVEQAKLVVEFCFEVFRITGGRINISDSLIKLYEKCKDKIVEEFLKINSLGISIKSIAPILVKNDDYESMSNISVIEILLTRQENGIVLLDEDSIKAKIKDLVNNATNSNVEMLLNKLVNNEGILAYIVEYIASLDSEYINNLPVSVSKHAISTFNRDNAESFKDNESFLSLVIKQGTSNQKKEVVRLMKDKINKEIDLDMVVNVLDNYVTENQRILTILIDELEGVKESDTVTEEDKVKVSRLIAKLSNYTKKTNVLEKILGK